MVDAICRPPSEVRRPCRSEDMVHDVCQIKIFGPFDLQTGMRVTSKVGNLPSKFGVLGRWVLELFARRMYATDGQTNGQTDGQTKAMLIALFPTGGGIITECGHLEKS